IEERKGARDVPPRAQRLDESNLSERRLQLRRTDLPLDALGQSHQRATLAILLCAACRSVLRQASPEIARLADVDQRAGGVVHAIDARAARNSGEKFRAEFPVEGPHAPLSQRAVTIHEAFCGRADVVPSAGRSALSTRVGGAQHGRPLALITPPDTDPALSPDS